MEQLRRLKEFFEGGFISKEEYEYRKKQIIDEATQTTLNFVPANARGTHSVVCVLLYYLLFAVVSIRSNLHLVFANFQLMKL